jgi:hypothetical protein
MRRSSDATRKLLASLLRREKDWQALYEDLFSVASFYAIDEAHAPMMHALRTELDRYTFRMSRPPTKHMLDFDEIYEDDYRV